MKIAITHSTTACVLLEIGSLKILTDPVFDVGRRSYRLGPAAFATRYAGPTIHPQSLPPLDAALLSHAHHLDNLDEAGREFVGSIPQVITGQRDSERAGLGATRLAPWETATITGGDGFSLRVTATPARHGPWWLPGTNHVIGFLLEWPGQTSGALYISGDTVYFRGLRRIAEQYRIGTALLHLGAVHFWPPWPPCFRFTMTGHQAARCARLLQPKRIVPIHYERSVWSHFRESRESYDNAFAAAGMASTLRWLRPGERTVLDV